MARRLHFTRQARTDLAAVRQWYSQPGAGTAAKRRVGRILAAISRLADQPYLGQPGEYPSTRKLTTEEHVVVYRLMPDTGEAGTAGDVLVLRIFGPGQAREHL